MVHVDVIGDTEDVREAILDQDLILDDRDIANRHVDHVNIQFLFLGLHQGNEVKVAQNQPNLTQKLLKKDHQKKRKRLK